MCSMQCNHKVFDIVPLLGSACLPFVYSNKTVEGWWTSRSESSGSSKHTFGAAKGDYAAVWESLTIKLSS